MELGGVQAMAQAHSLVSTAVGGVSGSQVSMPAVSELSNVSSGSISDRELPETPEKHTKPPKANSSDKKPPRKRRKNDDSQQPKTDRKVTECFKDRKENLCP
ncbi:unnamed protein product [Gongylonema pulchrum]|uniref:BZIP domain-containing protein n=1 Tax=Gongylonema pulchrum TaxID=637853 RepID=A0A183DCG7_9BILA|nr:unnamed protein product [Gongylonema pulchrum]